MRYASFLGWCRPYLLRIDERSSVWSAFILVAHRFCADETMPGQRIPMQGVAGRGIQPIVGLSPIRRLTVQMHRHAAFRENISADQL